MLCLHIIPNFCRDRPIAKPEHMSTAYFVVHNSFVVYHHFTDNNLFLVKPTPWVGIAALIQVVICIAQECDAYEI